jgi:hypothetical protein
MIKKDNNIRKVKSNKNKYNINNFINNEININIIDNNYLNQTLKNSFIKNNLLNEYYKNKQNIDDNNLQMSYQEKPNKSRSKSISTLMKKYNSDRLRSIKEKYLNNDMNSNSINKISLDEKDEKFLSDKDSENNYSNNNESNDIFIITAPRKRRKKNSKASTGITPIKHEIFVKILLSILGKDNRDSSSQIKENSSRELNHIDKNR